MRLDAALTVCTTADANGRVKPLAPSEFVAYRSRFDKKREEAKPSFIAHK